jgi:hypothetical protein
MLRIRDEGRGGGVLAGARRAGAAGRPAGDLAGRAAGGPTAAIGHSFATRRPRRLSGRGSRPEPAGRQLRASTGASRRSARPARCVTHPSEEATGLHEGGSAPLYPRLDIAWRLRRPQTRAIQRGISRVDSAGWQLLLMWNIKAIPPVLPGGGMAWREDRGRAVRRCRRPPPAPGRSPTHRTPQRGG